MDVSFVYILECSDSSYYTGKTDKKVELRVWEHQNGVYSGYTAKRRPVKLVWSQGFPTYIEAIAVERQIKRGSRTKKEALIKGNFELLHELAKCKNETHYSRKVR
jgi:putative endonuclease